MLTSKYKSVKIINSSLRKMNKKYIEFNLKNQLKKLLKKIKKYLKKLLTTKL